MATKADFTEEEWKTLQKGLTGAGIYVSISDRDFTDTFGEASALANYLAAQREVSSSPLMRELAATHGSGFGMGSSPDKVEAETLAALRSATEQLAAKAPDAVDAYRELALGVADKVASAKGGGISPAETAAIQKIKEALDLP